MSPPWIDGFGPNELPPTRMEEPDDDSRLELVPHYPVGWTRRPDDQVMRSWLSQVTVVHGTDAPVRLQARLDEPVFGGVAGDQFAPSRAPMWPLAAPLLIIGSVYGPAVAHPEQAEETRDEIARLLQSLDVSVFQATTIDRGHRWTEPSLVVAGARGAADWRRRTLDVARRMGIHTVVQVDDGQWTVLAPDGQPQAPASLTRDVERRCPMQCRPQAGEYGHMRGGPWTGASIRAAQGWKDHRDRLVTAVGCDVCEGVRYVFQGRVRQGGGPIPLVARPMPTRWLIPDDRPGRSNG